jgi:hypothetical protein
MTGLGMYILDANRLPIPVFDSVEWAIWFATAARHVAVDTTEHYRVSTVFLGLDHQYGSGPPLLFETMVFLAEGETGSMDRYATWAEAAAGHERIASMLAFEVAAARKLTIATLTSALATR